jgi:hypothetical protein
MALQVDHHVIAPKAHVARRIVAIVERDVEPHGLAIPSDRRVDVLYLDHRMHGTQPRHGPRLPTAPMPRIDSARWDPPRLALSRFHQAGCRMAEA